MKLVPRLAAFANLLTLIIFTVGLFGCDYASKSAAKASLEGAGGVPVAPNVLHGAVELRYAENRDVAFNALERLGVPRSPSVLLGLSGVAAIGIVALAITAARRRKVDESNSGDAPTDTEQRDRLAQVGLAVVISGALGNIVDRIARGYVVDFIHVKGWPIFNVADIAVCVGMGMIFLSHLWKRRAEARPPS